MPPSSCLKQNTTQWRNNKQRTTGSTLKHPMPNADEHLIIKCSTLNTLYYAVHYRLSDIGYRLLQSLYCYMLYAVAYRRVAYRVSVSRVAYRLADRLSAIGYRLSPSSCLQPTSVCRMPLWSTALRPMHYALCTIHYSLFTT